MKFSATASLKTRKKADVLIVPFWKGNKQIEPAVSTASFHDLLGSLLQTNDFRAGVGEVVVLYISGQPEKRLALLGLGNKSDLTLEKLRRAYAAITKVCHKKKLKEINLLIPALPSMARDELIRGICEGLLLPNYSFTALKHDALKESSPVLLEKATLITGSQADLIIANKCSEICRSVNFARDLVNGNADDVTPQHLCDIARGLQKNYKNIKTTIFDKKRIEKEKMGLLLAVNRGSFRDPAFIIVDYTGNPKSHDRTVIVGKGITFDTGGLLLKPRGGMETMKDDMAGAAAALGTIQAIASLGMPINVTAVVPSTENSIDARSYKPGDVYKSCSGKTVEIGDTDAEGRLVLADALTYVVKHLKPSRIIDLATLTGSVIITLGDEASGLMSNNDALADLLARAGSDTGERVWRLPLYDDYKDLLKSDVADIKNVGGRPAGSITAALFLQEFVGNTPWAHLDIAGTAFLSENKRYTPKHGTGVGIRLLVSLLESL